MPTKALTTTGKLSPAVQGELIIKTVESLSNAIQSTFKWLETREKRKGFEAALKVEAFRLKCNLEATRGTLKQESNYLKTQLKDNINSREIISKIASDLITLASQCISDAKKSAELGNNEFATKMLDSATNVINVCSLIIKDKFQSGPLTRRIS